MKETLEMFGKKVKKVHKDVKGERKEDGRE